MRTCRLYTVLLLLAFTGLGCDPGGNSAETTLCSSDVDCPPTHVCGEGACAPTCFEGVVCQGTGTLSGALHLTTLQHEEEEDATVLAEAAFVQSNQLHGITWEAIPGSDCVRVPSSHFDLPIGVSAGVIHLEVDAPQQDEESAVPILVLPDLLPEGVLYTTLVQNPAQLKPHTWVRATAAGETVPGFGANIQMPQEFTELEGVAGEFGDTPMTVEWEPQEASQILLRITGNYTNENGPEDNSVVCPARDQAGQLTVPPNVLGNFTGRIHLELVRRNMTQAHVEGSLIPVIASSSFCWWADRVVPALQPTSLHAPTEMHLPVW